MCDKNILLLLFTTRSGLSFKMSFLMSGQKMRIQILGYVANSPVLGHHIGPETRFVANRAFFGLHSCRLESCTSISSALSTLYSEEFLHENDATFLGFILVA